MPKLKICHNCLNCLYIGEGDSICDINHELILDEWDPTHMFFWCGGKKYEEYE